jgi:predicted Zn-dependent protease
LTIALGAQQPSSRRQPKAAGVNFYSLAAERELGRTAADEFSKKVVLLRTSAVTDYVGEVGARLAAEAPIEQFRYSVTVFRGNVDTPAIAFPQSDADSMEAVAFPGGPVFLSVDLIEKLDNEAELAAVLAHAIAHVALRHSTRTATRAQIARMAATPATVVNVTLLNIAFKKFTRGYEMDADTMAVQLMTGAAYDPRGLLSYIRKVPSPRPMVVMSSPFPSPEVRIRNVEDWIGSLPVKTYAAESGGFAMWKRAVGTSDQQ